MLITSIRQAITPTMTLNIIHMTMTINLLHISFDTLTGRVNIR